MNSLAFTLGLNLLLAVGMFSIFLAIFGLLAPKGKKEEIVDVAVRRFKSTSSFARLKPEEKMMDRLAVFCLHNFHLEKSLEEMHMQLGSPDNPQPVDILYTKIIAALAIPAAIMLLFQAVWPVILVPVCFMVPDVLIKSKIQKRQAEILGNFSTTVDLAALIIESGLDYLTAFERIIKIAKEKTILEEELDKTINEIKLGYSRREALERFSARTGVQEVRSLVGLIIQSDELGTSLVDLLRNFSSDLRSRRLSRAEKLAAQASTKMLFPLFMFIFPTIFILILAPMIMGLVSGGMGF
ncbi:type II secretion system F family protein [Candidatus Avelusimicrobium alvi]|uniref:type II secretion system F family protein n=1 Tax=Candidatus Avelusimicrobium alvi TaxID=3416221 RepID=UPI003D0A8670